MKKSPTDSKSVQLSFRVTTKFRDLLKMAAAAEMRSQASVLHVALYKFCERKGIKSPSDLKKRAKTKARK